MRKRHSDRVFSDERVSFDELKTIVDAVNMVPSSCDRQGVYLKTESHRNGKEILGGLLVGGVGWIHRANKILLIFASKEAYKENLFYMPYLDAGVVIQQIYLVCTAIKLKCCYVNPNVRTMNVPHFEKLYGRDVFCGAMAIGK